MDERNKWAFWAVAIAAFLTVCIPSTVLLEALSRYRSSADFGSAPLRASRLRFIPHRDGHREEPGSRLGFVEFSLRAPKAKSVGLTGDFNGWKDQALPMAQQPDGRWELTLPLPKGRHFYVL